MYLLKTHTVFNPYVHRELSMKKPFRDFESAREFARSLNLKSTKEWREYTKSGNKPDDIPNSPDYNYKNDFKGYGDWLGTGRIATQNKIFRPFTAAREFARSLNLKNANDWRAYFKSDNIFQDIPSKPYEVYKNIGWVDWGDWLGTGRIAERDRVFRSFAEAREFVQKLGLKGQQEWAEYCKSDKKPDDIPTAPWGTYKNEFKGMGDFLGTGTIATQNKIFRPFAEARDFVRSLGLKGQKEWKTYCTSGNKPDDIPSTPWTVYKEWKKK